MWSVETCQGLSSKCLQSVINLVKSGGNNENEFLCNMVPNNGFLTRIIYLFSNLIKFNPYIIAHSSTLILPLFLLRLSFL